MIEKWSDVVVVGKNYICKTNYVVVRQLRAHFYKKRQRT